MAVSLIKIQPQVGLFRREEGYSHQAMHAMNTLDMIEILIQIPIKRVRRR